MAGDKMFDLMKKVTEGTYQEEVTGKKTLDETFKEAVLEAKSSGATREAILSSFEKVLDESDVSNAPDDTVKEEAEGNYGDASSNGSAPTEDTLESVLHEEKKEKKEEWKDERSHDEAVKQIVRDTMKELHTDGVFKGEKEPTREEIMAEVEFQSKHGLDHRQDASAIRYDAFKKVMKRIKNIVKKLDAESEETPEEEDAEAKSHYETPSTFIGMKT